MRGIAALIGLLFVAGSYAADVLIVQEQVRVGGSTEFNVPLANAVADTLSAQGRVTPIVWSLTDPLFRRASEAGILGKHPNHPTLKQALESGQKWGVKYVLYLSAVETGGSVKAGAALYADGVSKALWEDQQQFGVQLGGKPDWDGTAKALAERWAVQLAAGPFKIYPPKAPAVPLDTQPRLGPEQPTASPEGDDPGALKKAAELLSGQKYGEALVLLRDAVDLRPLDPQRRLALARALFQTGHYREAADEATRAVLLAPEVSDLRILAAESWLAAQEVEKSKAQVNEALARAIRDPRLMRLQGQIAILEGRPAEAVEVLTQVIQGQDGAEARFERAVAYAMLGNGELCRGDITRFGTIGEPTLTMLYRYVVLSADRAVETMGEDLRRLLEDARLQPKDAGVIRRAEAISGRAHSFAVLFRYMPCPQAHKSSHEQRVLAHQLLAQCAAEALEFARTGSEDVGAEATLSLGEALKPFVLIRAQYRSELPR
jgi:tetratricopeptide (TPR) repeat protein